MVSLTKFPLYNITSTRILLHFLFVLSVRQLPSQIKLISKYFDGSRALCLLSNYNSKDVLNEISIINEPVFILLKTRKAKKIKNKIKYKKGGKHTASRSTGFVFNKVFFFFFSFSLRILKHSRELLILLFYVRQLLLLTGC